MALKKRLQQLGLCAPACRVRAALPDSTFSLSRHCFFFALVRSSVQAARGSKGSAARSDNKGQLSKEQQQGSESPGKSTQLARPGKRGAAQQWLAFQARLAVRKKLLCLWVQRALAPESAAQASATAASLSCQARACHPVSCLLSEPQQGPLKAAVTQASLEQPRLK